MHRWLLTHFMTRIPGILLAVGTGSREVRTGIINHRNFEALGVGLALPRDIDVHPVEPAIPIRVKRGLDPQIILDPLLRILERLNNLRLAVVENRSSGLR